MEYCKSTKVDGMEIHYLRANGKLFATIEALGLQIGRVAEDTPNLGPYDEKAFAEFARLDIAKRILAGE
ncbi:MAG TPA: hypothetical protein VIY48_05350 [Candidatus Paceibacterota bacterium]